MSTATFKFDDETDRLIKELEAATGVRGRAAVIMLALRYLERSIDAIDIADAREALDDMKAKGQKPIPWEDVKADLGMR